MRYLWMYPIPIIHEKRGVWDRKNHFIHVCSMIFTISITILPESNSYSSLKKNKNDYDDMCADEKCVRCCDIKSFKMVDTSALAYARTCRDVPMRMPTQWVGIVPWELCLLKKKYFPRSLLSLWIWHLLDEISKWNIFFICHIHAIRFTYVNVSLF